MAGVLVELGCQGVGHGGYSDVVPVGADLGSFGVGEVFGFHPGPLDGYPALGGGVVGVLEGLVEALGALETESR